MTQIKSYTLTELAQLTGSQVQGDPNCLITGLAPLQEAQTGHISFLANPVYRKYLASTRASAVIVSPTDAEYCATNVLIAADPYAAYARITQHFAPQENKQPSIHPTAVIGKDAIIHPSCHIGPLVVVEEKAHIGAHTVISSGCIIGEGAQIGENSFLHPRVTLYSGVRVGNRVTLQTGAVIGSDGFGFAFNRQQHSWIKIYHSGSVVIEDDVEVGANTTIDRGALDNTIIHRQVKIDNQVQIAHNVVIGEYTVIAGCVGIAGSAHIGKYCRVGGGACIAGHIEIADNITISGMSMVTHSLSQSGEAYSSGTGIMENSQWRKSVVRFRHLDDIVRKIQRLEKTKSEK